MKPETVRLYFEDPYQIDFEARVREQRRHGDRTAVILDQTAFYPESGGQPADRGSLNGIRVVDVVEDGSEILHVLAEPLEEERVKGKIDWNRRFDHMQQHAGQHILSQSFYELFNGETRSFHLGESVSTLEIDLKEISDDELDRVEARANTVVFEDRPIRCRFVNESEIGGIPLRRPPQKKGRIRVVEVDDFDHSACGGTHPRRAGEIGLIKILKYERIRGHLRFEFVCGSRALRDYGLKDRVLREIALKLTISEQDAVAAVDRALSEIKVVRKENKVLSERIAGYEAAEILREESGPVIQRVFSDKTVEELRALALDLIQTGKKIVLFGSEQAQRIFVVFARPENVNVDLRELVPVVAPLFQGRGGGGASLVQIAGEAGSDPNMILNTAREFLAGKLPELDI